MKVMANPVSKGGKNSEGYADPTATIAISDISKEQADADKRAYDLVKVLKYVVHAAGFEMTERVQLKDKKTGRVYK